MLTEKEEIFSGKCLMKIFFVNFVKCSYIFFLKQGGMLHGVRGMDASVQYNTLQLTCVIALHKALNHVASKNEPKIIRSMLHESVA